MAQLNFTASNPNGNKAQIRKSEEPWDKGYSVFTWKDSGSGVILWREKHELPWDMAFQIATDWVTV
jgi:hypothetical protein